MQIMITNGGPHPADKWADVTTKSIVDLIQIADDADTPQAAAARKAKRELSPVLFAILMDAHDHVQKHERGECKKNSKRLHAKIDPTIHSGGPFNLVMDALAKTPFAVHFAQDHVRDVIRLTINQHFADAMHIERCWHKDRLDAAQGA